MEIKKHIHIKVGEISKEKMTWYEAVEYAKNRVCGFLQEWKLSLW